MKPTRAERAKRAEERSDWPVRAYCLGAEPGGNLSASTTPRERLGMMWELALQAWSLSARPLPDYPRESAPGRMVRSAR